jgi:hypothetical protein
MILSRAQVLTANAATADNDTRYALGAIHCHLSEDGATTTTTATNGHLLIQVTERTITDGDYPAGDAPAPARTADAVIPADLLVAALKVAPAKSRIPAIGMVRIADQDGAPVVQATDLAQRYQATAEPDLSFPGVDRVLPSADLPMTCHLTLTGAMLADLAKIVKALQGDAKTGNGGTLTLSIPTRAISTGPDTGDVTGAVRLTARAGDRTLIGALMGVRR